MTHFELVQSATDLLSKQHDPAGWLEEYDAALAAHTDDMLVVVIERMRRTVRVKVRLAA